MRAHAAVLIACILALPAKTSPDQPAPSLEAIRTQILKYVGNIPRYTCTETIGRQQFHAASTELEYRDRIRLEVIVIGGHETVAWPGASHFEDKDIRDLIQNGTTAKGDFAGFALKVIAGDAKDCIVGGQEQFRGRSVLRVSFEVHDRSHGWVLKVDNQAEPLPFKGFILLDSATLELVHLERQFLNIPLQLGVVDARASIDYGPARIGNSTFVLPQAAEEVVEFLSGAVSQNQTSYQSCREYTAESMIRFDESEGAQVKASVSQAAAPRPAISPGALLDTNLLSDLNVDQCAIGDRVVLTARPLHKGRLTLPASAYIQGRIKEMHTRIQGSKQDQYLTTLKVHFSKLDTGTSMPFHAQLKNRPRARNLKHFSSSGTELNLTFAGRTFSKSTHFQWEIVE